MEREYQIRLLELRKKINELIERELRYLDDNEITQAKRSYRRPLTLTPIKKGRPEMA